MVENEETDMVMKRAGEVSGSANCLAQMDKMRFSDAIDKTRHDQTRPDKLKTIKTIV